MSIRNGRASVAARLALLAAGLCAGSAAAQTAPPAAAPSSPPPSGSREVEGVVVTASTRDLLGVAVTSSQGAITRQELELRPVYRPGQLLETIPGLTVTSHSGEGKANQYLLRGFNLDHGTDLATFIDGMPVNMRTHAHGQGYTDLNFLIPELAGGVDFSKGPYYAAEGDFAVVGADHLSLVNTLRPTLSLSAGTVGDDRLFLGGSTAAARGDLLAAAEVSHLDGPWTHPDNARKLNLALRYSRGDARDGWSLTALYNRDLWNATTDQPQRAVAEGLIDRFGTLDPSDGGQNERYSLSGAAAHQAGPWSVKANAYVVRQQMTLWNDFTHLLNDPVNGDQEAQNDRRTFAGGTGGVSYAATVLGVETLTTAGVQGRFDHIYVDRRFTVRRRDIGLLRADRVEESSVGLYVESTVRWTPWLRSIVGLRGDVYSADDSNLFGGESGAESKGLFQPKASLVLGPFHRTEFYVSAGDGFHSNDARSAPDATGALVRPPLLVTAKGYEAGVRTTLAPHLQLAATLFQTDFASELTYNADDGSTEAGRPSRRVGVELTAQYRPVQWLELNANLASTHARYRDRDPAGRFIPDAPSFIGSAGFLIDNLGPWFGALAWRDLGDHPLIEDGSVRSPGYQEVNLNVGYKLTRRVSVRLDVFNLTDSKDNAADYLYADRIALSEPAAGVTDIHSHPLEPRSARVTLTATF
jgi:outer membrane receptor protein involved in Fe transport